MSHSISRGLLLLSSIGALVLLSPVANAQVTDPANDFIPSYTGAHNGDLDVLSANVIYEPVRHTFFFTSTFNGNVGTTPDATYVWGFNRGAGAARFPTIAPGVLFDSVVVFTGTGVGSSLTDLTNGGRTNLSPAGISISGATLTATIPASLLPSRGLAPEDYTFNLWPRAGGIAGLPGISDFAPNNSNIRVQVTPEPGVLALTGGFCLALLPLARRRRALK